MRRAVRPRETQAIPEAEPGSGSGAAASPRVSTTPEGWPMRSAPPAAAAPARRWARVPGVSAAAVSATLTVTLMDLCTRPRETTRAHRCVSAARTRRAGSSKRA